MKIVVSRWSLVVGLLVITMSKGVNPLVAGEEDSGKANWYQVSRFQPEGQQDGGLWYEPGSGVMSVRENGVYKRMSDLVSVPGLQQKNSYLEKRLGSMEQLPGEVVAQDFQPQGWQGRIWAQPFQQQAGMYLGKQWREFFFSGDTLSAAHIGAGLVSPLEFSYLDNLSSNVQEQLGVRPDSLLVKNFIANWIDTNTVVRWPDTLATVVTVSDTAHLHNQIVLKTQPSDTLTWDATKTDIVGFITSAALAPYIDSARVKVLDGAKADSGTVVFWADSGNALATKTDIRHEGSYPLFKGGAITTAKWYTMPDGTNTSATIGWTMPYAGYLCAVSQTTNITTETTPGTYYTRVMCYRAGVNQWICDVYDTTSGAGAQVCYDWFTNSTAATYAFQAGDIINGQIVWGTFVGTITGTWTPVVVRFTTPQGQ